MRIHIAGVDEDFVTMALCKHVPKTTSDGPK